MSNSKTAAESTAWDENSAREWAERDRNRTSNRLSEPWKLAALTSSFDRPVAKVLDVASGPGGFLEMVLECIPDASGVWFDFSEAMKKVATENLRRFGDRVRFQTGDMTVLEPVDAAGSFDLVTTSRATHHLLLSDLTKFYTSAHGRLKDGGWIANIDSLAIGAPWGDRLHGVRSKLDGPKEHSESGHAHPNPFPSLKDHLAAMRVAGFVQPQVVWSSLVSVLLMAQKP